MEISGFCDVKVSNNSEYISEDLMSSSESIQHVYITGRLKEYFL